MNQKFWWLYIKHSCWLYTGIKKGVLLISKAISFISCFSRTTYPNFQEFEKKNQNFVCGIKTLLNEYNQTIIWIININEMRFQQLLKEGIFLGYVLNLFRYR